MGRGHFYSIGYAIYPIGSALLRELLARSLPAKPMSAFQPTTARRPGETLRFAEGRGDSEV